MSDINPTRRTDEPPARDGAPLAGWPTVITAEEAVALQVALKQLQTALDAVVRERDEARAALKGLNRETKPLIEEIKDLLADDERLRKAHEAAHRQPQSDLDTAIRQRDEARARALKLWAVLEMVRDADNDCRVEGWATIPDAARRSIDEALEDAEVERLTRQRDEAQSSCAYPDCVDLGPNGKCTKWLTGKCNPVLEAKS